MVRRSYHNDYMQGITYLSKHLAYSRNTVYSIIGRLVQKGYIIEKDGGKYCINADVPDGLKPIQSNSGFFIVVYSLKRAYKLSTREAGLLYLFSWLSANPTGKARARCCFYIERLKTTERQFYKSKRKLEKLGLITSYENNMVSVTKKGSKEFAQLVHASPNRSDSAV